MDYSLAGMPIRRFPGAPASLVGLRGVGRPSHHSEMEGEAPQVFPRHFGCFPAGYYESLGGPEINRNLGCYLFAPDA